MASAGSSSEKEPSAATAMSACCVKGKACVVVHTCSAVGSARPGDRPASVKAAVCALPTPITSIVIENSSTAEGTCVLTRVTYEPPPASAPMPAPAR